MATVPPGVGKLRSGRDANVLDAFLQVWRVHMPHVSGLESKIIAEALANESG